VKFFRATRGRMKGALPREEPLLYPYSSGEWLLELSPVVVFAPHPDDETFGCGGLLLRVSRKECDITFVAVTDGGKGAPSSLDPQGYVDARRREFESVARKVGAEALWWGIRDRETVDCSGEIGEEARRLVEGLKPDVVFLPSPWEIHPDHRIVTEAILKALQGFSTRVAFYEGVIALRPNVLVDISEVADEKMELMKTYSSQVDSLPYHFAIEGLNRHRTLTVFRSFAVEAFVVLSPGDAQDLLHKVRDSERLLLPAYP